MKKTELMIIDDEPVNLSILNGLLSPTFLVRAFRSGLDAYQSLGRIANPELILCDVNMPEMNGFEFADKLRSQRQYRDIPLIFITSLDSSGDEEAGFKHGAVDYITKPISPSVVKARVNAHLELKTARDRLKNQNVWLEKEVQNRIKENQIILESTIGVVTQLVETRDSDTGNHIDRTKAYYDILAHSLQKQQLTPEPLTDKYIASIIKASPLHDIGKIGISDTILLKPGKLTPEEFDLIKSHTLIGAKSLQAATDLSISLHEGAAMEDSRLFFHEAKNIALYHHERWDGTGYPHGLKGNEIPLSARIMALVDVLDALTNKRVYKAAWGFQETIDYLIAQKGTHFDPLLVEVMLSELDAIKAVWAKLSEV